MKKKNKISPIFAFFIIIVSFFVISGINFIPQTNTYEFTELTRLGELIGTSEASGLEIGEQAIDSILNAKIKYIEFSDSKEFNRERNIVYKLTNMAESEKYSEGSMRKAIIRIALEDLNDDGVKEILAYIIQFEYCGKGGGYCTFLILQRNATGSWRELFKISTYPDIGISTAKKHGFRYLFFRNLFYKMVDKEKVRDKQETIIWGWDGIRYIPSIKSEGIYDPKTKIEKRTIMRWDVKSSSWIE
jgi:hypothetical protein